MVGKFIVLVLTDSVINVEPVTACPVVVDLIVMLCCYPAIISIHFIFSTNCNVKVDQEREEENLAERRNYEAGY